MLQGLINNNAVIRYILISKLIPAEKTGFYTIYQNWNAFNWLYQFTLKNWHDINYH